MNAKRYSWRRFGLALGAAIFFMFAGWGVREAENNGLGYTNDTSMWVFAIGGLCAYYALIVLIVRWWAKRKGVKMKRPGYWD